MGRYDALTQLEDTPEKPSPTPAVPSTKPLRKKTDLLASQQTSNTVKSTLPQRRYSHRGQGTRSPNSPAQRPEQTLDTSHLTTKEKTKYGTYLTDESIDKISIRAIQLKRDAHQIVQEAVNQYFEKLEK
jgi:hypothetical protein